MNRDEIIEQAARVLSTHETFTGKPHPRDHHRRQARALADAGLLAQPHPHPDPEPDWLDAPAVLARGNDWVSCADPQVFSRENKTGTRWVRGTKIYRWDELTDVTPLYPKETRSEILPTDKDTGKHWAIRAIQATIGGPQ